MVTPNSYNKKKLLRGAFAPLIGWVVAAPIRERPVVDPPPVDPALLALRQTA